MASEKLKLFSKIELEILANGAGTLQLLTDVPGSAMARRCNLATPLSNQVSGAFVRRTWTSRLPYNMQGHMVQAILTPGGASQITLYRARIWGRILPGGDWEWFPLPVIDTPVEFSPAALPIPPTPEAWHNAELPIPPTPEEWRASGLPIPPTSEEWRASGLPIPPTPEDWRSAPFPLKSTPPVPQWVDLGVDK